jgi:hypothetical protein
VIKYNKDTTNKLVYFLSSPPTSKIISFKTIMHMEPFTQEAYKEKYPKDEDFKGVYQQLQGHQEFIDKDSIVD